MTQLHNHESGAYQPGLPPNRRTLIYFIRKFNPDHPGVDLTAHGSVWTDVEPKVSDISITYNHQDDVASDAEKFRDEKLALVCTPDFLVDGNGKAKSVCLWSRNSPAKLNRL